MPDWSKNDIMLCLVIDSTVEADVTPIITKQIKKEYLERSSVYSPPLEIIDLGWIGKYDSTLAPHGRDRRAICIISDVRANHEWFEDIVKDAISELEKEGIVDITGVRERPIIEVFEE